LTEFYNENNSKEMQRATCFRLKRMSEENIAYRIIIKQIVNNYTAPGQLPWKLTRQSTY